MRQILFLSAALWMGSAWACVDLTGNWKGTCSVQGTTETFPAESKIAQTGCTALSLDEDALTIGQTKTDSRTEQGVTESTEIRPDWNADQSALVVSEKLTAKEQSSSRTLFEMTSKETYSLSGQKLVTQLVSTERDASTNPPQVSTRSVNCEFTKQ